MFPFENISEQGAFTDIIEWLTLKLIRTLRKRARVCVAVHVEIAPDTPIFHTFLNYDWGLLKFSKFGVIGKVKYQFLLGRQSGRYEFKSKYGHLRK